MGFTEVMQGLVRAIVRVMYMIMVGVRVRVRVMVRIRVRVRVVVRVMVRARVRVRVRITRALELSVIHMLVGFSNTNNKNRKWPVNGPTKAGIDSHPGKP